MENNFNLISGDKQSHLASAGNRLMDLVVDSFFIYAFSILLTYFDMQHSSATEFTIFYFFLYTIVLSLGYYSLMEFFFQKSIGKFLTKCTVVNHDGTKPSIKQVIIRSIIRLLPFVWVSMLDGKIAYHDKISKTLVIQDNILVTLDLK